MFKYYVKAPENLPEMTLQSYVSRAFPLLSASAIRDAFAKRDVKMNGVRSSKQQLVIPGSEIVVFTGNELRMPVLYEDEHILIVNKPAGVSTDEDRFGSMTVLDWAFLYAKGAYQPRMCHRLDNQTSGLLVLAKNEAAENALKSMFAVRSGEKEYRCLVKGTPQPAAAVKKAYLVKDALHSRVFIYDTDLPHAKEIVTEYKTLRAGSVSFLRILLHTGRTHQIRAHMQHLGHPLLGDDVYGDRVFNRDQHARGLALCAVRLKIDTQGQLPAIDGVEVCIKAPFEAE